MHCAHELVFPKDAHKDVIEMLCVGLKSVMKSQALFTNTPLSLPFGVESGYSQNWGG